MQLAWRLWILCQGTEVLSSQATAQKAEEFEVKAGHALLVLEQNTFAHDTECDNATAGMRCIGPTVQMAVVMSGVLHANDGKSTDCLCCFR